MELFDNIRKTISNARRGFSNAAAKGWVGISTGRLPKLNSNWGAFDFLTANEISVYVNRAINKRAEKVGEAEFQLLDKNGKEITNNPLLELLYKPNPAFNGKQFWSLYQKYYDLTGEAYIFIERAAGMNGAKPKALHLLRPDLMKPEFADDGTPIKFVLNHAQGKIEYEPDDIIYNHNPDPKNPLRGQSLIRAGVATIKTEQQISSYHARILENGGKIEGIFKFKSPKLTEEQIQQNKEQYRKQYSGAKNAGEPLFLGGDVDYQNIGLTPTELSFLEAKRMTVDDICVLTDVPKPILASLDDVKFDNADAARITFLGDTIRPLLRSLTNMLDERFFPGDQTLSFVDPTPERIDEKIKMTKAAYETDSLTLNERRELLGLDVRPEKEADLIYVDMRKVPLVRSGTNEGGGEKRAKKTKQEHPLRDPEFREMYGKIQVKRLDRRQEQFQPLVEQYFKEQRDRLINTLDPQKTRVFRKKGLLDEIWNSERESDLALSLFLPVLTELLIDAGVDATELVGAGTAFNMSTQVQSELTKRTALFTRQINKTTFDKLQGEFAESFAEGESREKLQERIRETYGDISDSRAATIARTEAHNAIQAGTMDAYQQAGMRIKIWAWAPGVLGGVRDQHQAMDGEEVPIDAAFSNGLMRPGEGPAAEVINCQCNV